VLLDQLPRLLSRDPVLAGKVFDLVSLSACHAIAVLIPASRRPLVCHSARQ
jgi:hypothetical protein